IILLGFGNGFGFRQLFGILIKFGISATVWDFGNSLGFGIWDLGFGIWDLGFRQNSKTIFRHMSNPKHVSATIGFGTQV
ncbi:hypothetical protein RhiirA4_480110, partial [Rhizophagus irregularis]